jgi:pilus assembly protein CpaC
VAPYQTGLGGVSVPPSATLFAGFPSSDLQVFVQALAENQYLRILAEPTLTALSGEEATFLAGGEFPIPVVQGGGGVGTNLSITIEYKEFGVRLRFRPTVLGDGTIRLHVGPEVSDLSDQGAVEIQGFRIPSLITRRAETTLELKSGQTFAMAGLLNDRNLARSSRVPALGDVPVLGALFRSVRYEQGETELVVLVTTNLVEPLSVVCPPPVPGVTDSVPNDWEVYMEGRTEGHKLPCISESDAEWLRELGFDELVGPGAWEEYGQPAAPGRGGEITAGRMATSAPAS